VRGSVKQFWGRLREGRKQAKKAKNGLTLSYEKNTTPKYRQIWEWRAGKREYCPYVGVVEPVDPEEQPENNPVRVEVVLCEAGSGERDLSTTPITQRTGTGAWGQASHE
jgi:hypothetical protein